MKKSYSGKLIRDGIPEKLAGMGISYSVREIPLEEYVVALKRKLQEESQEVMEADLGGMQEELADVTSVVRALAGHIGLTLEDVIRLSEEKDEKRGAFKKRLALDWTDDGKEE